MSSIKVLEKDSMDILENDLNDKHQHLWNKLSKLRIYNRELYGTAYDKELYYQLYAIDKTLAQNLKEIVNYSARIQSLHNRLVLNLANYESRTETKD